MDARQTRRATALLLRLAAQVVSGEDTAVLSACKYPLRQLGLDVCNMEDAADELARRALAIIEGQVSDEP